MLNQNDLEECSINYFSLMSRDLAEAFHRLKYKKKDSKIHLNELSIARHEFFFKIALTSLFHLFCDEFSRFYIYSRSLEHRKEK
jgi:hypothetical protein